MENISKNEINFRIDKIKTKAHEISKKVEEQNEELNNRYNFAKKVGIKESNICNTNNEIIEGLNKYIEKTDEILTNLNDCDNNEKLNEQYKLLNNMLYLDDIKLSNINELVQENKELTTKEYINKFAEKANDLIRNQEIISIDKNIEKYSKKNNIFEKITGKSKIKKALLENYNLKRVEVMNKKYIPDNKSLYEIISITKNCGYKSKDIDDFISAISNEYNFEIPEEKSLVVLNENVKIPMFFNKEFVNKINVENANMIDKINEKKKIKNKPMEQTMYNDMLIQDISTLELLNFNDIIDEVI